MFTSFNIHTSFNRHDINVEFSIPLKQSICQYILQYTYFKDKRNNYEITYKDVLKGIVHFEIHFWYVLDYLKGIQDVCVFVSSVFSILTFFSQTVVVCQLYTGG